LPPACPRSWRPTAGAARDRLAPATGAANLPPRQRRGLQIILPAIDRRAGEPGNPVDDRKPAPARAANLRCRQHPPAALIELAPDRLPAIPDTGLVDHATGLRLFAATGNLDTPSHTDAPNSVIVRDVLTEKQKTQLTEEEKENKSKRKLVQEKLIKFATRIPAFMYLTDYRENTLYDVITKIEPGLFQAVTGLTVEDFNLLVSLKVFNTEQMNQAVFAFRRYEDASLRYTGIESHEGLTALR
jgi:hypothetical protein